ncbi:hypothetical protein OSTOST_12730, partial [Ostertagia ostertagi]
ELLSNFWELSVQSKIVYRYDVAVYLGNRANSRAVNYLRGPRDDYAQVTRRRVCLCALQLILARYHIASEGSAVIYDGSAIMFSSEDLAPALKEHHGILTINTGDLPVQLSKQIRFYCPSGDTLTIEICRCRDDATSFDIADLSAQYGVGCLYSKSAPADIGCGYEVFTGARKGIKFIERRQRGSTIVVPALILDHRAGTFFKSQNLMKSVQELEGLQHMERFDFSNPNDRMNPIWNKVNDYVKGL